MAQSESKFCNKFNSFRIVTIKKEFGEGLMNLIIFSLTTETLLGGIQLLLSHLVPPKSIKFRTYANQGGRAAMSVRTFAYEFF